MLGVDCFTADLEYFYGNIVAFLVVLGGKIYAGAFLKYGEMWARWSRFDWRDGARFRG